MGCAYYYNEWQTDLNSQTSCLNPILLHFAMQFAGYTIDTLADTMGIPSQRIRELEYGLRQPTQLELVQIGNLLGFLPSFFYRETIKLEESNLVWVCGEGIRPCQACGRVADYLCDYPMGHGKTCDLPLCNDCRQHIGIFDYCPTHSIYTLGYAKQTRPEG